MNHNTKIKLKANYIDYFPIAIHTWNYDSLDYGNIVISNEKRLVSNTNIPPYMFVKDLYNTNFQITSNTFISVENLKKNGKVNFISMLLASCNGNHYRKSSNFGIKKLKNSNIILDKKYDCNYLIPPIHFYKEIIDEYCFYSKKNDLSEKNLLNFQILYGKARIRIQNQLSYKLGQVLIINSKSIWSYLSLPFIVLSIVISHKQEQKIYKFKIKKNPNFTLPPLETYPDYNEALKEKECFTYKLGQNFIKASKSWYRGGVYQVYLQRCA